MRARPRSIAFLCIIFLLAPLVILNQLLMEAHFNFSNMMNLWSWSQSLTMVGSLVIAAGIWSVRPWGYITCLALVACGVLHSLYGYIQAPDLSGYVFLLLIAGLGSVTAFLLQRHVSSPYFNPRQRWWETPTRYRAQFQVLASVKGVETPVELIDISCSGCFIEKVNDLTPGDLIHIRIAFLDVRIELMTRVVRTSRQPVDGIGLMFVDLTRADRSDLSLLIEHLQSHRRGNNNSATDNAPTAA